MGNGSSKKAGYNQLPNNGTGMKLKPIGATSIPQGVTEQEIQKRMDLLGKVMSDTSHDYIQLLQGAPDADAGKAAEYKAAQSEYKVLQAEMSKRAAAQAAKAAENAVTEPHTFVNGFGEATKREITSGIYQAAMRRNEKEISAWMSGWK